MCWLFWCVCGIVQGWFWNLKVVWNGVLGGMKMVVLVNLVLMQCVIVLLFLCQVCIILFCVFNCSIMVNVVSVFGVGVGRQCVKLLFFIWFMLLIMVVQVIGFRLFLLLCVNVCIWLYLVFMVVWVSSIYYSIVIFFCYVMMVLVCSLGQCGCGWKCVCYGSVVSCFWWYICWFVYLKGVGMEIM